ncbi:hypothetical protein AD006_30945 (plasmid) [Pseudonocardia sp. EC080610-09]|uniref:acyl-CoA dehydrogenase family protein n=1 Tax=Pseudonocardia sp. EC080610-09 TaxID=1688404 RepID=UPI000706012E|nr:MULTISPECIES: acyl-CoA dehydrogenase family protein [unclassified Pseudonocardia]ALL79617.1 hypothetical protein AD006_30945 [Pseudonocardia sp. EC080610-09]ALL85427.1 hypothetical protein AD017_30290 [Pseudonocardia sp. EC080619-01]
MRDSSEARDAWRRAGAEVGIAGLLVPESLGGSGASLVEAARVSEVLTAKLATLPYLGTAVMAPSLLTAVDAPQAHGLLESIADGTRIATVGWAGADLSRPRPDRCRGDGPGTRVSGTFDHVVDADLADMLLLVDDGGQRIVMVRAEDVAVHAHRTFDLMRPLSTVTAHNAAGLLLASGSEARAATEAMVAAARLTIASESAGGAEAALTAAAEYARGRIQFGRPIGGFQAIKHMLADAYVASESALSVARAAVRSHVLAEPDAAELVALACFYCPESFAAVAATNIQVHGGLGFTAECPAHLLRRRAEADRQLLGEPDTHRREYLAILAGEEADT